MTRMRRALAAALALLMGVLLSGCMTMNVTATISDDLTITGTMETKFSRSALEQFGGDASEDMTSSDKMLEDMGSPEGVTVETIDDGTYLGYLVSMEAVTPETFTEIFSSTAGEGAGDSTGLEAAKTELVERDNGDIHLSMPNFAKVMFDAVDQGMRELGSDVNLDRATFFDEANVTLTSPGRIKDAPGATVEGRTATWDLVTYDGDSLELTAAGNAFPWWIVIALAGVIVAGAVVLTFVLSRRGRTPAAMAPAGPMPPQPVMAGHGAVSGPQSYGSAPPHYQTGPGWPGSGQQGSAPLGAAAPVGGTGAPFGSGGPQGSGAPFGSGGPQGSAGPTPGGFGSGPPPSPFGSAPHGAGAPPFISSSAAQGASPQGSAPRGHGGSGVPYGSAPQGAGPASPRSMGTPRRSGSGPHHGVPSIPGGSQQPPAQPAPMPPQGQVPPPGGSRLGPPGPGVPMPPQGQMPPQGGPRPGPPGPGVPMPPQGQMPPQGGPRPGQPGPGGPMPPQQGAPMPPQGQMPPQGGSRLGPPGPGGPMQPPPRPFGQAGPPQGPPHGQQAPGQPGQQPGPGMPPGPGQPPGPGHPGWQGRPPRH